jgi:hypothetical protein
MHPYGMRENYDNVFYQKMHPYGVLDFIKELPWITILLFISRAKFIFLPLSDAAQRKLALPKRLSNRYNVINDDDNKYEYIGLNTRIISPGKYK